jgi:hypothetical protein
VGSRGRFVGIASVASAGCRLFECVGGLSFCARVKNNSQFDAFVFRGCEDSVESVGASVGRLGVKKPGVDEWPDDSLLSCGDLLSLEPYDVGKSRLDGIRDNLVFERLRRAHSRHALFSLR